MNIYIIVLVALSTMCVGCGELSKKESVNHAKYDSIAILKGEQLYAKNCLPCHYVNNDVAIGPGLKDITLKRDSAWLFTFILYNKTLRDNNDSLTSLLYKTYNNIEHPKLNLTKEDVDLILEYIKKKSKEPEKILIDSVAVGSNPSNNPQH